MCLGRSVGSGWKRLVKNNVPIHIMGETEGVRPVPRVRIAPSDKHTAVKLQLSWTTLLQCASVFVSNLASLVPWVPNIAPHGSRKPLDYEPQVVVYTMNCTSHRVDYIKYIYLIQLESQRTSSGHLFCPLHARCSIAFHCKEPESFWNSSSRLPDFSMA